MNEVLVAPGSAGIATEPRVRASRASTRSTRRRSSRLRGREAVGARRRRARGPAGRGRGRRAAGRRHRRCSARTRGAARLETSKAFCHEVATRPACRTAQAARSRRRGGRRAASDRGSPPTARGVVLKADGLAAGKGVIVRDSADEALELAPSFLAGAGATCPPWSSRSGSRAARPASSRSATVGARSASGGTRSQAPVRRRHAARTRAAWARTRRCRTSTTTPSSA